MRRAETGSGAVRREALDYSDYATTAPLFEAFARLPAGHPERADVREELVASHLPLAGNIARKFVRRDEPHADLTQVAIVGLLNAIDRFDPYRGSAFLSFAIPTVTGEVRQYLRDSGWAVHVPRRLKELHSAIAVAVPCLSQRYRRAPTATELAAHLGVDREEILRALEIDNAYRSASLDAVVTDGPTSGTLAEMVGAYDDALSLVEDREALRPLLAQLPPRELRILMLRFFGNRTQTQIAAELGISQVQTSRLLTRTLATLRGALLADC